MYANINLSTKLFCFEHDQIVFSTVFMDHTYLSMNINIIKL